MGEGRGGKSRPFHLRSSRLDQPQFRLVDLSGVIAAWEHVAVTIEGHRDR
jgi:hypothetical protein